MKKFLFPLLFLLISSSAFAGYVSTYNSETGLRDYVGTNKISDLHAECTDGQIPIFMGGVAVCGANGGGGGGSPGGSSGQLQFNNAGSFGGTSSVTYNSTTQALTFNRQIYVSNGGSDSNSGTAGAPMLTLQAAAARLAGNGEILVRSGDYFNDGLDITNYPNIKIRGLLSYFGPVRYFYGEKKTSFTNHSGNIWKTTISTAIPADIPSGVEAYSWVFDWDQPEEATIITQATTHPLQKDRLYRLPHARLMQVTTLGAVTAGKFFYDSGTSTLYFQRYDSSDPNGHDIWIPDFTGNGSTANKQLITGGSNENKVEVENVEVYFPYTGINLGSVQSAILKRVIVYGAYYSGVFMRFTDYSEEWNNEYAAAGQDGVDYLGFTNLDNISNHQKHFSFNGWMHDCGDQNQSWHGQTAMYNYGGLSENARNGGVLGGQGIATFYDFTSRNNERAGILSGIGGPAALTIGPVTVTIASPAVFTATAHGLHLSDQIQLTTTGALPTGLTASTTYYVISAGLTANTFEVSTAIGGAAVNTSGSQSGIHTLYKIGENVGSVECVSCNSVNDEVAFGVASGARMIVRGGSVINPTVASFSIASGSIIDNYGCMVPDTKISTGSGTLNHLNEGLYGEVFISPTGSNGYQIFKKGASEGSFNAIETAFVAKTASPNINLPAYTNSFYVDSGSTTVTRYESYATAYHSFKIGGSDWNYGANGDFAMPNTSRMDSGAQTYNGKWTLTTSGLGTTQADTAGFYLRNGTAAANNAQQISPPFVQEGFGWKTNTTAASQSVKFRTYVLPVQASANPTAIYKIQSSINGGAYSDVFNLSQLGVITTSTWNGATIGTGFGGTGVSTWGQGDLPYYTSGNVLSKLSKNTNATRYLSNTGSLNAPAWSQVDLSNGVTGVLALANGGYWRPSSDDIYNGNPRNVFVGGESCVGLNEGDCLSHPGECTANYTTNDCADFSSTDQATCEDGHTGCTWNDPNCEGEWFSYTSCSNVNDSGYHVDDGTQAHLQVHDLQQCTGTVTACSALAGSETNCNNQDGCAYQANSCPGQPDEESCNAQPAPGCTWSAGNDCGEFNNNPGACTAQGGCTNNQCSDLAGQAECEGQGGCTAVMGNDCSDFNGDETACNDHGGCSYSDPDCSGNYYSNCTGEYCTGTYDNCNGDNHACNGDATACNTYGTPTPCNAQDGCSFVSTPAISAGGEIAMSDGANISAGGTQGTKIGTTTGQRIGFYNSTPISQPTNTTEIGVVLSNLGLRASGTAYPITTSGAVTLGSLTSGRLVVAGTSGVLGGDSDLTFSTDTLTATKVSAPTSITTAGTFTNTNTGSMGWSVVTGANTACSTTCTNACVVGFDTGALGVTLAHIVGCADASADECLCAGSS